MHGSNLGAALICFTEGILHIEFSHDGGGEMIFCVFINDHAMDNVLVMIARLIMPSMADTSNALNGE